MNTSNTTLIRATLAVTLLLGTIGDALAQAQKGEPVGFDYLKSVTPGDGSALSGECDGTTASPEITCRFTQLMVRYQVDPKDVVVETEKRLVQLRTEAGKDQTRFFDKFCGELRTNRAEAERKLQVQDITNPHTLQKVKDLIVVCANPTMAALEGLIRRITLGESKTCKISHFQNDPVSYKKVAPNKWVANVGPQGMCSSVYLYTMQQDQYGRWQWSQVRTYADTLRGICQALQINYKQEYGWQGEDVAMTCENITFGPP